MGLRIPSAVVTTAIGFLIIVAPAFLARLVGVASAPLGAVTFSLLVAGAIIEFGVWTIGLRRDVDDGFGRWSTRRHRSRQRAYHGRQTGRYEDAHGMERRRIFVGAVPLVRPDVGTRESRSHLNRGIRGGR